MSRGESYNTKQKNIIMDLIKKTDSNFTAKDLYAKLDGKIGLTTIYRLIDKLYNQGILIKSFGNDNTAYYSYAKDCDNKNHFYIKCGKCGHLEHIDCGCINELSNHILKSHNFKAGKQGIVITAICKECEDE